MKYELSEKDTIHRNIISDLPGTRSKHYTNIGGYEIYETKEMFFLILTDGYVIEREEKETFLFENLKKTVFLCSILQGGVEDFRYIQFQDKRYTFYEWFK